MRTALRWSGYFVGGLLILLLVAAAWIWFASYRALSGTLEGTPERLVQPTAAQLADAPRQLQVHGCVACHGDNLHGNLMFDDPKVARFWAPNLTLIAAHATDQQLARAIRQGIGIDGRPLLVMPSAQMSRLTDEEVAAIIAEVRRQPRGGEQTPGVKLGPLGRLGVATGKLKPQPAKVAEYRRNLPADLGPSFAGGRQIAMTHCSECHGAALGGGEPEPGTKAPDLQIAGAYDLGAFKKLLRTGVPADGRKMKLMSDVSRVELSHMTDQEIEALHAYLAERAQRMP